MNGQRCIKGGICEPCSDIPPNWKDIQTKFGYTMIYRNSLRSFLYIGAAGFTLDILVRFANFVYLQGIQNVLFKPLTCPVHFGYPAAPLGEIGRFHKKEKY